MQVAQTTFERETLNRVAALEKAVAALTKSLSALLEAAKNSDKMIEILHRNLADAHADIFRLRQEVAAQLQHRQPSNLD